MKKIILLILMVLLSLGCSSDQSEELKEGYTYQPPEQLNDGLETGYINESGINFSLINKLMTERGNGKFPKLDSLLIHKNGKFVLEEYFGHWSRDKQHKMHSVTKSMVVSIFGAAWDRGLIGSLKDKIFDYFPGYINLKNNTNAGIDLSHILTMTPGFEWDQSFPFDNDNSLIAMFNSPDSLEYVFSREVIYEPGAHWTYSGGCTQILAGIIQNVTGQNADEYGIDHFFGPLGITNFEWEKLSDGLVAAGGGLHMIPRDMLKVGVLYLNNGLWNGERVLSEKWVNEASKKSVEFPSGQGYGYQWWWNSYFSGSIKSYHANGNGGQIIAVFPDLDMVVVFTQSYYNKADNSHEILTQYILPAVSVN